MLHINFSVNVNIRLWDINTSGHVHIQMYLDIRHLFNIIFSINFCGPKLTAEYRRNYRLYGITNHCLLKKRAVSCFPLMNNEYNFNLYIKGNCS
jgi:hypothetical protein